MLHMSALSANIKGIYFFEETGTNQDLPTQCHLPFFGGLKRYSYSKVDKNLPYGTYGYEIKRENFLCIRFTFLAVQFFNFIDPF